MRNLKRALSLALAAVMVLGMMVIGASAASYDDFSDKDEIVNKEAVSVLVELGVIAGKDDGTYDPTGIITRAEMAKLICTVLNGGKDPNLGNVVSYTYADTVGHWAAPYIEYCTQLGIVAGDGAGNFNPNATVTGSEAAKMLLVATGYNAKIEGYVGANWEVTTNVRANMIGLYDGLTLNPSEGLTRDAAAQMVYNDLDALVVTYKYTLGTDGSTITTYPELVETNSAGRRVTVLEDKFGAVKVEAVVTSNDVATLNNNYRSAEDAGETYLAVTKDSPSGTSGIYTVDTDKALLGQTVNAYIKYKDDRQIVTDAVVIGSPIATADNKIVTSNDGTGLNDLLDDNKLDVDGSTQYYCNFGGTRTEAGNYVSMTSDEFDALCGITGVGITLIDNDNDKNVEYALAEQYRYGTVSKYTDDGFRIGGTVYDDEYDPENVIGYEDVARDDFVLYVEFGGNIYVQKPETQEAVLDAYSTSKKNVKLDGETIDWSGIDGVLPAEILSIDEHLQSGTALDASAVWYKDIFGYVIAVGDADEDNLSYAVLLGYENQTKGEAGALGTTAQAKLLLADGTVDTYKVATIDGDKVTNCTAPTGGTPGAASTEAASKDNYSAGETGFCKDDLYSIYSYTETEAGSMKLTEKMDVKGATDEQPVKYVKGRSTMDVNAAAVDPDDRYNFTVTANTVFLYMKENGSVSRFQGKTAPSINNGMVDGSTNDALSSDAVTVAVQANNRGEALVVFLNDVNPSNDFTDNFVYIYNQKLTETSDGYEASAIINGEIKTITITSAVELVDKEIPVPGEYDEVNLIKEGWYDDDANPDTPDIYGHYIDHPDADYSTSDGLYTYAENDDGTYVLRWMNENNAGYDYFVAGEVSAVSYTNNYVRVGNKSYTLTDSTLGFYARTGKTAQAEVTVSRYDDVVLVINDDDEIIYSFVTYYAYDKDEKPEVEVVPEGINVTVDGTNTITVTWIGDAAPSNTEIVSAIRAKLAADNGISVSDVTVAVSGKNYTFKAVSDFMTVEYAAFDITSATQVPATTTAPTVTVAKSAENGATVTAVVGAGETGSITGYVDTTADCVDITVSEAPANVTYAVAVTGATKTDGNTYDLTNAGTDLVITVTATRAGYKTVVYTYTYTVSA